MVETEIPNPGSDRAAALGCDCPVHPNWAGTEEPDGSWVIRDTCTVHGKSKPKPAPPKPPESVLSREAVAERLDAIVAQPTVSAKDCIPPIPQEATPWPVEFRYRTYSKDPELRLIDVLTQALGDPTLDSDARRRSCWITCPTDSVSDGT